VLSSLDLRGERFGLIKAEGAQQQVVLSTQLRERGVEFREPAPFFGNRVGAHGNRTIV